MNADRWLVVKGSSGLGNRIRCALTGIMYARLTGRRLFVDWRDDIYSRGGTNVFHRFFRCSLTNPSDEIPTTDSVRPSVWRGHLHEPFNGMRRRYGNPPDRDLPQQFSIDPTCLSYPEEVVILWDYGQRVTAFEKRLPEAFARFGQATTDDVLRTTLQEDLVLQPSILERVDRFRDEHFTKPTVGVHVRYSDRLGHVTGIIKRVDALVLDQPDLQIFLATDNKRIAKKFNRRYPTVITTPHWYPRPGVAAHRSKKRRDRIENGVEALVDLYLLAECDSLVHDPISSFSRVAALLTRAPRSRVFAVRRKPSMGEPRPEPSRRSA